MAWNFADIYEAIADVSDDSHPACIHAGPGGTPGITISWPELMLRSNRLARFLAAQGLRPDSNEREMHAAAEYTGARNRVGRWKESSP